MAPTPTSFLVGSADDEKKSDSKQGVRTVSTTVEKPIFEPDGMIEVDLRQDLDRDSLGKSMLKFKITISRSGCLTKT